MASSASVKANATAAGASASAAPAAPAQSLADSALDDLLTPMERNVKTYLTTTLSKDLIEILAVLAVERPVDAHLWLATKLLERAPTGPFIPVRPPNLRGAKTAAATPIGGGAEGGQE